MTIPDEAKVYTRSHVGGMQPVAAVGDKVNSAFIAGAEWARKEALREAAWRRGQDRAQLVRDCRHSVVP